MSRTLIVVDMQNDFIDGSLGTKEAQSIVPNVANKIKEFRKMVEAMPDTLMRDSTTYKNAVRFGLVIPNNIQYDRIYNLIKNKKSKE